MHMTDYILNGMGYGEFGEAYGRANFDTGLFRPYWDGRHVCVTLNTGEVKFNEETEEYEPVYENVRVNDLRENGYDNPTWNATSFRKEDWIRMDTRVTEAIRQPMRLWTDMYTAAGVNFDGYSKLTYEYEVESDAGEAVKDMDVLAEARQDSPLYKLRSTPLPIIKSDFYFSDRRIAVSRNSGVPISTNMAAKAARRVAEMVERTCIGTETGMTYGTQTTGYGTHDGTSTEYGLTSFPARNTKTDLTTPTGSNPEAVMTDVLEMIDQLNDDGFYGPFILYHSTGYTRYLSDDYFRSGGTSATRTLRERLMAIEGLVDIRRLNFLTSGFQLILVQMDREWIEAVNGMDVTTIMWESQGGARKNFRVMCIHVPVFKSDYSGNAPIVHATTS